MRMHRMLLSTLVLSGALILGLAPGVAGSQVSVSFFHEQLSPHGRWVVAGSVGDVWVPSGVAVGWAPYTDGEWTLTDYGWTWISYDPWGDIPCHYGAWAWADPYGWVWAPGTVWAPAWVTWAYSDNFVGWAPLPPSFAFSVTGYAGAPVVFASTRYVFVPTNQFVGVRVSTVRVPTTQVATIFPRTQKVTNFQVSGGVVRTAGPSTARIEKAIGRPISPVRAEAIKTRPTTIAEGGFTKASHVSVVVPETERRRAVEKSSARSESSSASKVAVKTHEAKPAKPESAHSPATSTVKHHEAKPEKPAAAHSPGTSAVESHSSASAAKHAAKSKSGTTEKSAPAEKHQASSSSGQTEKVEAKPPKQAEPEQHAAAPAHPAPKPAPKKPKPAQNESKPANSGKPD